jgi:hypothetical protein
MYFLGYLIIVRQMKQYIFFNGLNLIKHYELIFQLSKNYIKTSINIQSMMDFII